MGDPISEEQANPAPYSESGVTGLYQFGGYLSEEKLPQLFGVKAVRTYREMVDNDATYGAVFFAVEMLIRQVMWRIEPASQDPEDVRVAEFVDKCRDDMSHTWGDFIAEVLTMLPFGWSSPEIVYKVRLGPDQRDPMCRSKYNDGLIGWRKFAPRAQETLLHWEFDNDGGIKGWWQISPQGGPLLYLPIEKLLLFRTTSRKNNPEGRSVMRTSYGAWFRKKEIERIEATGVERDYSGIPVAYVPPSVLAAADENTKRVLEGYKKLVRDIKADEQEGIVLPSTFDKDGNQLVKLELLGTGSRRAFDTSAIIERYKRDILMAVLADILMVGHEKTGSFALADSKTQLFIVAISTWMDEICNVFNRHAIPRLLKLNDIPLKHCPKLSHSNLDSQNMQVFATALANIVVAGGLTLTQDDEDTIREFLGLPERKPDQPILARPQTAGETMTPNGHVARQPENPDRTHQATQATLDPNKPPSNKPTSPAVGVSVKRAVFKHVWNRARRGR